MGSQLVVLVFISWFVLWCSQGFIIFVVLVIFITSGFCGVVCVHMGFMAFKQSYSCKVVLVIFILSHPFGLWWWGLYCWLCLSSGVLMRVWFWWCSSCMYLWALVLVCVHFVIFVVFTFRCSHGGCGDMLLPWSYHGLTMLLLGYILTCPCFYHDCTMIYYHDLALILQWHYIDVTMIVNTRCWNELQGSQ